MKRKVLEIGIFIISITGIIILTSQIITLNNNTIKLTKENQQIYKYFSENNLLDYSKKVNLSSTQLTKDELVTELEELFALEKFNIKEIENKIKAEEKNNKEITNEINNLSKSSQELESKVKNLQDQYNVLNKKYQSELAKYREEQIRISNGTTYMINNFPTINQYPNYPTGCESVALTMLLKYHNVNVDAYGVIANLKKGSLPYTENNIYYGGNPELEFVGDPLRSDSYGVYEKPIAEVAAKYKGNVNIKNNFSFSEVLNLVKNNHPVMVWTSMGLSLPYISSSWIYKPTGEKIDWKAGEHAVIIIGYNNNQVIISDPMGGRIKYQSRSLFESRYNYFGKKAVYYWKN